MSRGGIVERGRAQQNAKALGDRNSTSGSKTESANDWRRTSENAEGGIVGDTHRQLTHHGKRDPGGKRNSEVAVTR